ncbi:hypothetical protein QPM17_16025 [Marinobacter sp. TBZ242]|uniref:Uncharacterized protein n=1 Tax=Marinobacter azerbaijanicus TaxID=3050455 RepID=A0ABT7IEQ4_9GAMM|nr:hypothetical protein [Marinobacter sp. TBZ242]MDL0432649.1 hypothetical protein [Marinobacter sp. TBZ242]
MMQIKVSNPQDCTLLYWENKRVIHFRFSGWATSILFNTLAAAQSTMYR